MFRTWRERRGDFILYYDQYKADGATVTEIYIDCVRKGKTINNRL